MPTPHQLICGTQHKRAPNNNSKRTFASQRKAHMRASHTHRLSKEDCPQHKVPKVFLCLDEGAGGGGHARLSRGLHLVRVQQWLQHTIPAKQSRTGQTQRDYLRAMDTAGRDYDRSHSLVQFSRGVELSEGRHCSA